MFYKMKILFHLLFSKPEKTIFLRNSNYFLLCKVFFQLRLLFRQYFKLGRGLCTSFACTFRVLGQQLWVKCYPGPQLTDSSGVFAFKKILCQRGRGLCTRGGVPRWGIPDLFLGHVHKTQG